MKNLVALGLMLGLISCNREAVSGRTIDQNVAIYLDSAGIDLLNAELAQGYQISHITDVLAPRDGVTVGMAASKDASGRHYLYYTAGATRAITGSASEGQTVQSVIALNFAHKTTSPQKYPVADTLILNYLYNDQVFQIIKASYNGKPVLGKSAAGQNLISVSK